MMELETSLLSHSSVQDGDVNVLLRSELVQNSNLVLVLMVSYVLVVKWIGPAIMASRRPFELKKVIIAYNFAQVATCAYVGTTLVIRGIEAWKDHCMIHKNPRYPYYFNKSANLMWLLYMTKLVDCLDTIFFVLRKKNNQISFLHVFHHVLVCLFAQWLLKNLKLGYYLCIIVCINTWIHVIMYLYYALAAFGPHMQKYLWWKKYLTIMQMLQFVTILVYMLVAFASGCEEPGSMEVGMFAFVAALLALFYNFYSKSFADKAK